MAPRKRARLLISMGLSLASALVASVALLVGTFDGVQLLFSDALFKLRSDETADKVVVVGIDEKTVTALAQHGRIFSWPRTFHAQVIDSLKQAGARVIVFDILFDLPAPGDEELARSIEAAGNVISPVAGDGSPRPPSPAQPLAYDRALRPLPAIVGASAGIAHANQTPDPDGSVRRVPLVINLEGQSTPAMPLAAAAHYLRQPQFVPGPPQDGSLPFLGRRIPVGDFVGMRVNYLGPPASEPRATVIPMVSFVDVLQGTFPAEQVRDRVVFIGTTASALADDYQVPTARGMKMDGVEIHAHATSTILGTGRGLGGFMEEMSKGTSAALVLVFALLAGLALFAFNPLVGAGAAVLLVLAYLGGSVFVFESQRLIADFVHPAFGTLLASGSVVLYRVLIEQREQRALQKVFATYVPPAVAQEIAKNPDAVKLGGERRVISVVFTDLKGFTTFSESVEPEVLSRVITQYLNAMTQVVFDNEGTVDKYIGDAVMAFWNAPQDVTDHARRACLTALEMQRSLSRLGDEWQKEGLPRQYMRIGANTGTVSVGNMGSNLRIAYTALGDTVNLGARLEPLNNEYGTWICISEFTRAQAGDDLFTRYLDLVAVKGKAKPVATYELIGLDSEVPDTKKQVVERYLQGIGQYQARRFAEAAPYFEAALEIDPKDGPSAVYLERCRELAVTPPAEDWDGVYVMHHK